MSSYFNRFFRQAAMTRITQLNSGNGGLIFTPAVGQHSATVILMHGLGDSADGLQDIPELWHKQSNLGHIKFILPTAPQRPVTLNFGHRMNAWYDIAQLDDRTHDPNTGIEESSQYIKGLLEEEMEKTGLPLTRIALAGFSQGGAMSLFTGLQDAFLPSPSPSSSPEGDATDADAAAGSSSASQRLAGLLIMSGYLPKASAFQLSETLKDTPILHCHGTDDQVVRPDWATKTRDGLLSLGHPSYDLRTYPRVGHSISMEILQDAAKFFHQVLPPSSDHIVKPKEPRLCSIKELKEAIRDNGLTSQATGFSEKSEFVKLLTDFYTSKGIHY